MFYSKNTLKWKFNNYGNSSLGISGLLFYMTTNLEVEEFISFSFMGIIGGVGIGLIIGGIVGYVSKGSSIKSGTKKKEWQRLQQKIEIEQQNCWVSSTKCKSNPNNSENSNL